jgi:hypothetical protein
MRDSREYASMGPQELRENLVRVTEQLAAWSYSLARQRAEYHVHFLEAFESSSAKSVAERVKDAEMAWCRDRSQIMDAEGQVAFHEAIRSTLLALIASLGAQPHLGTMIINGAATAPSEA